MKLKVQTTGLLLLIFIPILAGCTEEQRAKDFGGDLTINLPPGRKLLEITWKENDVWYLTTDRPTDTKPQTYTFERQKGDILSFSGGRVTIIEH